MRAAEGVLPWGLNGQQFDSDTVWYYLRARYYDPETGRFLSQDPYPGNTKNPTTLHRYRYANNDPVNNIDPTGEVDFSISSVMSTMQNIMFLSAQNMPTTVGALTFVFGLINPDAATFLAESMPYAGPSNAGATMGRGLRGIFSKPAFLQKLELNIGKILSFADDTIGQWVEKNGVVIGEGSSQILRENLKSVEMRILQMKDEAHHIMPLQAGKDLVEAINARRILQSLGIGPNHPANGVFLRAGLDHGHGILHDGFRTFFWHTDTYVRYVSNAIISASSEGKESVIRALQDVGADLLSGKVPY